MMLLALLAVTDHDLLIGLVAAVIVVVLFLTFGRR